MENLNDIFNNEVETAENNEGSICICILNQANSHSDNFVVYPENTLNDVLQTCKNQLGIVEGKVVYEYNGKTYSDGNVTVEEVGIEEGGKLIINPNGTVA